MEGQHVYGLQRCGECARAGGQRDFLLLALRVAPTAAMQPIDGASRAKRGSKRLAKGRVTLC
jgi:hypothetical protein